MAVVYEEGSGELYAHRRMHVVFLLYDHHLTGLAR